MDVSSQTSGEIPRVRGVARVQSTQNKIRALLARAAGRGSFMIFGLVTLQSVAGSDETISRMYSLN